jgi:hypothetical protein
LAAYSAEPVHDDLHPAIALHRNGAAVCGLRVNDHHHRSEPAEGGGSVFGRTSRYVLISRMATFDVKKPLRRPH